ncbi:hypothetical protein PFAG_04463 [Plasmodium falciparum Santa Lucia]|uniref:Uncharacterized protein n=1 Tax=Plasmodium falciparum Santa Lucia TaxID=478859 RepID=W7G0Q1_PLAFA|nr:hypothetical protein PFAG_04463 [Plasmodium falciparum Santa Lucia]
MKILNIQKKNSTDMNNMCTIMHFILNIIFFLNEYIYVHNNALYIEYYFFLNEIIIKKKNTLKNFFLSDTGKNNFYAIYFLKTNGSHNS